LPDDLANWGKRSARVRGVNPPKELKNGPVTRWLAGSEETTELTSAGYFPPTSTLIAGGEREGAILVLHVGDSRSTARRSGRTEAHAGAPVFGR
jgi:hypothetical protein